MLVTQSHPTLCNPWIVARQTPLSIEFSRQEYWSRYPFPSPGDLPDRGIKLLASEAPGELQTQEHLSYTRTVSVLNCCGCVRWLYNIWTVATRLLCPWDSPGKNTGVGCCALLQGVFPTQESNLYLRCLLDCKQVLYPLSRDALNRTQEKPWKKKFINSTTRNVHSSNDSIKKWQATA